MTALLGLLGMIQAAFLPGALLTALSGRALRLPVFLFLAFGFSVIINYILVVGLVAAGLPLRPIMCSLPGLEALLGLYLLRGGRLRPPQSGFAPLAAYARELQERPWRFAGRLLFLAIFCYLAWYLFTALGSVFSAWDTIMSWNRWARELAAGGMPTDPHQYPQLIPSLITAPYVFMGGTDIQFFSFALCLLFVPAAAIAAYAVYDEEPQPALLLAVLSLIWYHKHASNMGCADFPVLAMGLFGLCCLLLWRHAEGPDGVFFLLGAALFAAGAAVTKQAGLALLVFFPLIVLEWRGAVPVQCRPDNGRLLRLVLLALFIALPWYLYVRYQISVGADSSEIEATWHTVHQGRNYAERLLFALKQSPLIFVMALAALPGLFLRGARAVTLPGLLLVIAWAFLLSYDSRNVSFAVPFLALAMGRSAAALAPHGEKWPLERWKRLLPPLFGGLLLLAAAGLMLASGPVERELIRRQDKQSLHIGAGRRFNGEMMRLIREKPGLIVTSQPTLMWQLRLNPDSYRVIRHFGGEKERQELETLLRERERVYVLIFLEGEREVVESARPPLTLLMERHPYRLYMHER